MIFAKLGLGVRVDEAVRAEELALEALCSHPCIRGGRGGGGGADMRRYV